MSLARLRHRETFSGSTGTLPTVLEKCHTERRLASLPLASENDDAVHEKTSGDSEANDPRDVARRLRHGPIEGSAQSHPKGRGREDDVSHRKPGLTSERSFGQGF